MRPNFESIGVVHKLCNAEGGKAGPTKRFHTIFLLLKLIKILTKSVTWGEGVKNGQFWRYIIYGQPQRCHSLVWHSILSMVLPV